MSNSSPALSTANLAFVESLYDRFLEDPNSVPEDFRRFFESEHPRSERVRIGPSFKPRSLFDSAGTPAPAAAPSGAHVNGGAPAVNGAVHVNGSGNGAGTNGRT